jgi:hypothetical protein
MNFWQTLGICVVMCFVLSEYNFQQVEASSCVKNDTSCDECVGLKGDCYWCKNNKKCGKFETKLDVKDQKNCKGSDVYYKQCYLSSKLLIIVIPSVVGGLLLIIGCCIYCCCCRKCCSKKKGLFDKEDKKLKKERNERKQQQDHRKAERQARNEEIRMKYGLKPASGDSRYQRLDP